MLRPLRNPLAFLLPLLALTALPAVPAMAADLVGLYRQWGAFTADAGKRCYAISLPENGGKAYLSVVLERGGQPQFYARLPRERALTATASASVGGRRFALIGKGRDLFARDTQMDRAVIAAIRSARSLSIETVGSDGRAIVEGYDLRGAASAIDAARIACR